MLKKKSGNNFIVIHSYSYSSILYGLTFLLYIAIRNNKLKKSDNWISPSYINVSPQLESMLEKPSLPANCCPTNKASFFPVMPIVSELKNWKKKASVKPINKRISIRAKVKSLLSPLG